MDTNFSHLEGDIRQPVLVIGDDPDTDGNVLVAAFTATQSVPAASVYDSAVASPTDTVDDGGKVAGDGSGTAAPGTYDTTPTGAQREGEAATSSPDAAQPTAPSGDQAAYTDNGDGTYTRTSDGARGTFGPDGFRVDAGNAANATDVSWGQ